MQSAKLFRSSLRLHSFRSLPTPTIQKVRKITNIPMWQAKNIPFQNQFLTRKLFTGIELPEGRIPHKDARFTESHEWVLAENGTDIITIGISDHAQIQLRDLVYVEIAEKGEKLKKGDAFCTLESVKAASEVYIPFDGEVVEVNKQLADKPELINNSPYIDGWIVKLKISGEFTTDKLMDEKTYEEFC